MVFIYKISNKINSRVYIGLTNNLERRFNEHKIGKGSIPLYKDIIKYGEENFDFSVLEEVEDYNQASQKEIQYIYDYDAIISGYNMTAGGEIPKNKNSLSRNSISLKEKKKKRKREKRRYKEKAVSCQNCLYSSESSNKFFCRKFGKYTSKKNCFRGKEKGLFAF